LPPPQRRWAIATVALAIFLTVVDQTIVNVALPTIAADLNVDASSSVWIVNAYQVAIMLSRLPLSAVGDIFGYNESPCGPGVVRTSLSLGCALAPSLLRPDMDARHAGARRGRRHEREHGARAVHPIRSIASTWHRHQCRHHRGLRCRRPNHRELDFGLCPLAMAVPIKVPIAIIAIAIGIYALPETPRATHPFDVVSSDFEHDHFRELGSRSWTVFSHPTPAMLIAAELASR